MALEPECAFDPRSSREHPGLWMRDWLSLSPPVSTFQSLSGESQGSEAEPRSESIRKRHFQV
jgi:hypothetical protein